MLRDLQVQFLTVGLSLPLSGEEGKEGQGPQRPQEGPERLHALLERQEARSQGRQPGRLLWLVVRLSDETCHERKLTVKRFPSTRRSRKTPR